MKVISALGLGMLGIGIIASPLRADSMIDVPGFVGTFAQPNAVSPAALGQTFTTGTDTILTGLTFYGYQNPEAATFAIAPWTGTAPGAALFWVVVGNNSSFQPLVVNTGLLALSPNAQYIAFLTASTATLTIGLDVASTDYAGGADGRTRNGIDWFVPEVTIGGPNDFAFKATFLTAAPLPPAGLSGLGLLGVLGMGRLLERRRTVGKS